MARLFGLTQDKEDVDVSVFQIAIHIASQMSSRNCTVHLAEPK